MSSRSHLYAEISDIRQLRAERHSLLWHIKGVEKQFGSSLLPAGIAEAKCASKGKLGWIPLAVTIVAASVALYRRFKK